jgi:hypothetical protein
MAVNCKDDHRRHQYGSILVTTDNPSSLDNNVVGDEKLIKEVQETCQIMGCIAAKACTDIDEKNGTEPSVANSAEYVAGSSSLNHWHALTRDVTTTNVTQYVVDNANIISIVTKSIVRDWL